MALTTAPSISGLFPAVGGDLGNVGLRLDGNTCPTPDAPLAG